MTDERWNSCERKIRYETQEAAEFALRSMQEVGKSKEGLNAYRCTFGGDHWHLGRRNKGKRKRDRRKRARQARGAA